MVFHWSVLDDLNNAVVWIVSTRPVISKSSSPCTKNTNYKWYNRHFYVPQFFQFLNKVKVLIPLFSFFRSYSVVRRDSKVHNSEMFLHFCWLLKGLAEIRWSVCILKSLRSLCFSFTRIASGLFMYYLFVWPNFNKAGDRFTLILYCEMDSHRKILTQIKKKERQEKVCKKVKTNYLPGRRVPMPCHKNKIYQFFCYY